MCVCVSCDSALTGAGAVLCPHRPPSQPHSLTLLGGLHRHWSSPPHPAHQGTALRVLWAFEALDFTPSPGSVPPCRLLQVRPTGYPAKHSSSSSCPFLSTEPTTDPHTTVSCALRPPHRHRSCSLQPRPQFHKCLQFTLAEGLPAQSGLSDPSGRIFCLSPRSSETPSCFSGRTADCPVRLSHQTAGLSRVGSGSVPRQPWCPPRLAHEGT